MKRLLFSLLVLIALCGAGGAPISVGSTSGGSYYDYNFTWAGGTTTGIPKNTETITHNVGRYPDKIVVFYEAPNGWMEAYPRFETTTGDEYGWDAFPGSVIDESSEVILRFYTNGAATTNPAVVRLFWFTQDDVTSAANGLKSLDGTGVSTTSLDLSTTETNTGRKYLGSDVFSKVINLGACPNATTTTDAHGVSGGIDAVLGESKVMGEGPTGVWFPFEHAYSSTGYDYWQIDTANGGNITLGSGANRSTSTCWMTLYYTKP